MCTFILWVKGELFTLDLIDLICRFTYIIESTVCSIDAINTKRKQRKYAVYSKGTKGLSKVGGVK